MEKGGQILVGTSHGKKLESLRRHGRRLDSLGDGRSWRRRGEGGNSGRMVCMAMEEHGFWLKEEDDVRPAWGGDERWQHGENLSAALEGGWRQREEPTAWGSHPWRRRAPFQHGNSGRWLGQWHEGGGRPLRRREEARRPTSTEEKKKKRCEQWPAVEKSSSDGFESLGWPLMAAQSLGEKKKRPIPTSGELRQHLRRHGGHAVVRGRVGADVRWPTTMGGTRGRRPMCMA